MVPILIGRGNVGSLRIVWRSDSRVTSSSLQAVGKLTRIGFLGWISRIVTTSHPFNHDVNRRFTKGLNTRNCSVQLLTLFWRKVAPFSNYPITSKKPNWRSSLHRSMAITILFAPCACCVVGLKFTFLGECNHLIRHYLAPPTA
ncbi:hypothetical protein F890_01942 [Acinetobacter sp. CIP 64.7]|nr:hypothetical protein F890_01942 [Acinetobacter sp. CIP 64.7]